MSLLSIVFYPTPDKPDDILWIGVEGYRSGLYRYDLKTKNIKHLPMNGDKDDFASNFLFDICADKSGNLWLAGDYGVYKFNRETEQFTFFQNKKKNSNSIQAGKITTIYSDNNNVLWFGSKEDGVSYFDKNTENFVHFREDKNSQNSLPSNSVIAIYQDKNHRYYWFGTVGGGLSKYDFENKTFKNYTMNDGLPNNVIYGILEDDNGNLWLSTNYGLSKFNIETETFTNYSTSDGLTNIEYNTGAYFKNSEGLLFFGGINGFDYFNPAKILINDYQPPILLTSIKINNIELYTDSALNSLKRLDVSYLDDLISIDFAALSYFQSSENQYSYILEGVYTDWVNIGTKNTITLSSLKSGNYTLKIKASNNDGVWNETAFELPINIKPPVWEKWWFVVFSSAIFIIIVLLILRYRQIQFKKKQKELEFIISERTSEIQNQKEELQENADNLKKAFEMVNTLSLTKDNMSSMLVHDLKNPLNSIINYARLIQKSEKPKMHDISEKTVEIEKSALGLLSLVNNLLDIAKMEEAKMQISIISNSLNNAINEAIAQINYPAKEKQLEIENRINLEIEAEFDSILIVRVLVNLLTNAIKFSENNGKIIIDYEIFEDEIKLKITDFGAGIPQEYLDKVFDKFVQSEVRKLGITQSTGLGLTFSKLAIEAHKRQIGVISNVGEGSTFWFTLKLLKYTKISENKVNIEVEKNTFFTNDEIIFVKKLLNSLKFFQTGEIFSTLANSEFSSPEFLKWRKEVEKAVLYTNEEYYNELTK